MDPNQQQNSFNAPPKPQSTPSITPDTTAPAGPAVTPAKKPNKNLILGLIIGGAALLIGLVVTILIVVMGGVSKQDYSDAQKKASDVASSYSDIASVYISSYSTTTEVSNDLDTIKTGRASLNEGYKKLSEMKAVKNDKKAADLYKKLDEAKTKLDTYLDAEVEYFDVIHPVVSEVGAISYTDVGSTLTALEGYQTKLKALDLKQTVNKEYINKITAILPDFISALEAYANMTGYDSSLYTKVSEESTKLTAADTDWKSNLNKLRSDADFSGAVNDLGEYLTDKTNGK